MNLGDAYYFPDGHLTFVIALPDERTGEVVIVNISHWEAGRDESCVIEPGEHPDVHKKSIVFYKFAQILTREQQADFERRSTKRTPLSEALLSRVQEGTDSDYIPQKCERMVAASCKRQKADRPRSG